MSALCSCMTVWMQPALDWANNAGALGTHIQTRKKKSSARHKRFSSQDVPLRLLVDHKSEGLRNEFWHSSLKPNKGVRQAFPKASLRINPIARPLLVKANYRPVHL